MIFKFVVYDLHYMHKERIFPKFMTSLEQLPVQTKTDRVVDTGIDILRACILSKI